MHVGSRNRLNPRHQALFPGDTLFARLARTVCNAGVLPRKELYESWEVARRVRRRLKGGRVVDWACGHGLLAHVMLILDDSSPAAIAFDPRVPPSAAKLTAALTAQWPRLSDRVVFVEEPPTLTQGDLIVSCHACGSLTDEVIDRAVAVQASVAVLPCCHEADRNDDGGLTGWMDFALAIDATRAARLRAARYAVWTQTIPSTITPKHRLLIATAPPHG